jgi:hypothetical protein
MTLDRLAQMLRHIQNARRIEFRNRAKLLEAAVRNLAVFSAQTKEAAKAAAEIVLFQDDGPERNFDPGPAQPKKSVVLPPGVRSLDERPAKVDEQYVTVSTDEAPDAVDRAVVAEETVADRNDPDKLMAFFGAATKGRG